MPPNNNAKKKPRYESERGSSTERGYDRQWRNFRVHYLTEHPLCVDCLHNFLFIPSTEIHHITKLSTRADLKYIESNLKALCNKCHNSYTSRGL